MRGRSVLFAVGVIALGAAAFAFAFFNADLIDARLIGSAHALPSLNTAWSAAAPGIVEPYSDERVLAATTIGPIVYVGADEGDHVKAGQVIAEIDNAELKAQLEAANAEIAIRKSELERLQNGARDEEKQAAAAATAEAAVAVRLATSVFNRRVALVPSGISSQISLDQAHAERDAAEAHYQSVLERQRLIEAPARPEDIAIEAARLAEAQAHAKALAAAIEQTQLRSPIDGVLLRRYKNVGDTVSSQPPTLVAIVGDMSRLRVHAYVDEADIARVAVGQQVEITADAYGTREFSGRVTRVGVRMGPKRVKTDAATEKMDTQSLEVVIDLDKSVRLPVGLRVDVLFKPLPDSMLSQRNGGTGRS